MSLIWRLREQARSHGDLGATKTADLPRIIVGASLLAKALGQAMMKLNVPTPSRASPLPQGLGCAEDGGLAPDHCGSELARESAGSGDDEVKCADAFAGKPAPTGIGVR
ncbi:hypothetical protein AYO71_14010 [Pseudomonas koreensis]|nr:hypothetical protein AYO71_14010 [Pseudomonas koreensis]